MQTANKFYNFLNCNLPETTTTSEFIESVVETQQLYVSEIILTNVTKSGTLFIYFRDHSIFSATPPKAVDDDIQVCVTSLEELCINTPGFATELMAEFKKVKH